MFRTDLLGKLKHAFFLQLLYLFIYLFIYLFKENVVLLFV